MHRRYLFLTTALSCALVLLLPAYGAQLPQEHPYQTVLRDYLAGLKENDLKLSPKPIEFKPEWVDTEEKAYPIWLDFCTTGVRFNHEFTAQAASFTLSKIESDDGIRMNIGRSVGANPETAIWWANCDYPGNPWKGDQALLRRAFVLSAVDLMMDDALIHSPAGKGANRGDFVGGHLKWIAITYQHTKDLLPTEVAEAYKAGMLRLFERLEEIGPDGRTDNMNTMVLPGLVAMSQAIDDPALEKRLKAYAAKVIAVDAPSRMHPAGVIRDAGGIETSYNGIALYHTAWAALESDWDVFDQSLKHMVHLKGLLTLPGPDGYSIGPSHFNSREPGSSPNDQWGPKFRDIAIAMIEPESRYLMAGGGVGNTLDKLVPPLAAMQRSIQREIDRLNQVIPHEKPYQFGIWAQAGAGAWSLMLPYVSKNYRPGFYTEIRRLAEENDPAMEIPLLRNHSFEAMLPEPELNPSAGDTKTFFMVRRPAYYLVSFTGNLGWHPYLNWGGGGISAYWTEQSGALILGRSGRSHTRNTWNDWRSWPVNTISGATAGTDGFSFSRLSRSGFDVEYSEKNGNPVVTVQSTKPLNAEFAKGKLMQKAFKGKLHGKNGFTRTIEAAADGIQVTLKVESDGQDQLSELFESLPIYLKDVYQVVQRELPPTVIEFEVSGKWMTPTTGELNYVANVSKIRLSQFEGSAEIVLDRPRPVRLPKIWETNPSAENPVRRGILIQPVQIDLLDGKTVPCAFPTMELSYSIRNTSAAAVNVLETDGLK